MSMLLGAVLVAGAVLGAPDESTQDEWTQDFEAARTLARSESKDLLLDFTGSDWCFWCKRLHEEVFATAAFAAAREHFVPVTVDFPKDVSRLPAGVEEQNAALLERYPAEGYPTIWLLDAQGRPYASTGYREGGVELYLEHLAELRLVRELRDAAFAAAADAEGLERARALDRGLDVLPRALLDPHYSDVIDQILALDPEDAAGLATKYALLRDPEALARVHAELEATVQRHAGAKEWELLRTSMQSALERYGALRELAQFTLLFRAVAELELGRLEVGLASLEDARGRDPRGRLVGRIDRMISAVREESRRGR